MKRLYLAILEGPDPRTAVPVVASEDAELIRLVGQELSRRLSAPANLAETDRRLRLVPTDGDGDDDVVGEAWP